MKYLLLWELNEALIPVDPKTRATGFAEFMKIIQRDTASGFTKDWGSFVGTGKGYCVVEGSEVEVTKRLQPFTPFCRFTSYPIASTEQMIEVFKSMIG